VVSKGEAHWESDPESNSRGRGLALVDAHSRPARSPPPQPAPMHVAVDHVTSRRGGPAPSSALSYTSSLRNLSAAARFEGRRAVVSRRRTLTAMSITGSPAWLAAFQLFSAANTSAEPTASAGGPRRHAPIRELVGIYRDFGRQPALSVISIQCSARVSPPRRGYGFADGSTP